jgi:midasin
MASSSVVSIDQGQEDDKHESEAEREEKAFREYFPDHAAEFQRIISSLDEDEDDQEPDSNQVTRRENSEVPRLSDKDLSLVVKMHDKLFSADNRADDNLRIRAFVASYDAASRMSHLTNWIANPREEMPFMGSHIFALALRCSTNRNVWLPLFCSESIRDFHNDPFPSESVKADLPLRELLIRIAQLLRAFPGHSILLGIGQVVERMRQLDIQVTPLGKVMAGLEVILRRAQDWEEHASQHVQLGKPLKDISVLVTSWRKLELQSWSFLLTLREKRRGIRACQHWPRMYSLIHKDRADSTEHMPSKQISKNTQASSPAWVWKGFPKLSKRLSLESDTKNIDELARLLDTFILSSNLAECTERLALVKSFANELRNECLVHGPKRLPLARLMHSLFNHYERLMPILMQRKDKLREPIEKRLKDEVKLAKWDEQSYYSLVSLMLASYHHLFCVITSHHLHLLIS